MGDERLEHGHDAGQMTLDFGILLLDSLLGAQGNLQLLVGLLTGQLLNAALQVVDLVLGTLADGALGLAI